MKNMRRSGFGYRFHHVNQAWQKGFDIDQAFEKLFRHTATISKSSLSLSVCLPVCHSGGRNNTSIMDPPSMCSSTVWDTGTRMLWKLRLNKSETE